jgi:hypothetical protein
LANGGPYLVFAPSDDAFASLPKDRLDALMADPEALAEVVRYHILEGYYPPFTMSRPTAVNLRGDKLAITGSEQLSVNGDPVAGGGDTVMLANGTRLIWTSKVLLPPTAQTRPQDVPNSTTAVRHTAVVGSPAISPDGTHLVTGSNDTTSRLWELGSGQELRRIETPGAQVQSAAFFPGGQFVATSGSDGRPGSGMRGSRRNSAASPATLTRCARSSFHPTGSTS